VLILSHFEELRNVEPAQDRGIIPRQVSVRALERLEDVFQEMPGGSEGIWG
jgi:hypothetical protein